MSDPIPTIDDPRYVKAMSHPLRVRIIAMLTEREASPLQLSEWLGATVGTVSYHVRTLHRLGVIKLVRKRQVRGAIQHFYRAREHPRVSDEAWAVAPSIAKQAAVGSSLQLADDYAQASAKAGGFDRPDAQLKRDTLRLDEKGWRQAARAYALLLKRMDEIAGQVERRSAKHPHADEVTPATLVLMLFERARAGEPR
jgi:DNA-binding transcriptional ArsR family regulator